MSNINLNFIPIKTEKILPPVCDIYKILDNHLPTIQEYDIIFITSKILAIHQGRTIAIKDVKNKDELVKKEADYYIDRDLSQNQNVLLTIINNSIMPTAGIDESNSNGYYILWPKNINKLLDEIRIYLQNKYNVKNLAIVTTDSKTTPLQSGISGFIAGLSGINPILDKRQEKDIFNKDLLVTQIDQLTPITQMAVLTMGEGNEQTPICIARSNINQTLQFDNNYNPNNFFISKDYDIYKPMLKEFYKNKE